MAVKHPPVCIVGNGIQSKLEVDCCVVFDCRCYAVRTFCGVQRQYRLPGQRDRITGDNVVFPDRGVQKLGQFLLIPDDFCACVQVRSRNIRCSQCIAGLHQYQLVVHTVYAENDRFPHGRIGPPVCVQNLVFCDRRVKTPRFGAGFVGKPAVEEIAVIFRLVRNNCGLAGLHELPFLAKGGSCPAAAELMDRLAEEKAAHSRARSQLVFALLCELADADSAAPALPPLVQAAIEDIRANYAGLYGVEELRERLGVSKSHLVRTFTAAVGVPPGKYLTTVRIEAAQRLLLHREYTLDVVASLCGFSGANYLCRVFKKETGQSPAQWRALTGRAAQSGLTPEETMREQEMYI